MKNIIENEWKDTEELLESSEVSESTETVKKHEIIPNVIATKYTRPPAFQKPANLWRWNTQTNNRQRPGRAAWRGR